MIYGLKLKLSHFNSIDKFGVAIFGTQILYEYEKSGSLVKHYASTRLNFRLQPTATNIAIEANNFIDRHNAKSSKG